MQNSLKRHAMNKLKNIMLLASLQFLFGWPLVYGQSNSTNHKTISKSKEVVDSSFFLLQWNSNLSPRQYIEDNLPVPVLNLEYPMHLDSTVVRLTVDLQTYSTESIQALLLNMPPIVIAETEPEIQLQRFFTFNDPERGRQWYAENDGTFGTQDADIDLDSAQMITTGDSTLIIAVIDAGFSIDHPEIINSLYHNPTEIPENGVDDDNNGYVDDVLGWNFGYDNNDVSTLVTNWDGENHGGEITAMIAAEANNALGFTGIAPKVKVLPIRIFDNTGAAPAFSVLEAVDYAMAAGADVLSISFVTDSFYSMLHARLQNAWNQGVHIISSAGNQGTEGERIMYPGGYDTITINVGATDHHDQRPSWSNYNEKLDFVAPGQLIPAISSTDFTDYTNTSSGTSFAVPMVTGTIALILSILPDYSPMQVYELLRTSAQDQVGNPDEDTPGWDKYHGWGRINAGAALWRAWKIAYGDSIPPITTAIQQSSNNATGTISIFHSPGKAPLSIVFTASNRQPATLEIYDLQGKLVFQHKLQIDSENSAHNVHTDIQSTGVYWALIRSASGNFIQQAKLVF